MKKYILFICFLSLEFCWAQPQIFHTKRSAIIVPETVTYPVSLTAHSMSNMECENLTHAMSIELFRWEHAECGKDAENSGCQEIKRKLYNLSVRPLDFRPYRAPFLSIDPNKPPMPTEEETKKLIGYFNYETKGKNVTVQYLGDFFVLPLKLEILFFKSGNKIHDDVMQILGESFTPGVHVRDEISLISDQGLTACSFLSSGTRMSFKTELPLTHQDLAPREVVQEVRHFHQLLKKNSSKGNFVFQLLKIAPLLEKMKHTTKTELPQYLKMDSYELFWKFYYIEGKVLEDSKVKLKDFEHKSDTSLALELFPKREEDSYHFSYQIQVNLQLRQSK